MTTDAFAGDSATVIAATWARWDGYQGHNERDVFGTLDASVIAAAVDDFCRTRLGSGVAGYVFYATSVCGVHGVRLEDGRNVVIKVHRGGANVAHLAAVHAAQRRLVAAGYPAPAPILAPAPLAGGVAVVDEMLSRDGWADAHEPPIRRLVAGALARQIELCRKLVDLPGLKPATLVRRQLWARPHDHRFDFVATGEGAEWIDRLGAEARRRLDEEGAGEIVVGHNDWRVEHLRFAGGELSAVWDWDSLSTGAEPAYAGSAAGLFVADWNVDDLACVPTLTESLAFIADYEAARVASFSPSERRTAVASLVATTAYCARCEHSDALTEAVARPAGAPPAGVPVDGYLGFLAAHGPALLGVDIPGVPALRDE